MLFVRSRREGEKGLTKKIFSTFNANRSCYKSIKSQSCTIVKGSGKDFEQSINGEAEKFLLKIDS
jgi:hypothetical protein